MRTKDDNSPISDRDYRLDVIKAASICLVVVWHVNPLKTENLYIKGMLSLLLDNLSLIGVPSFLTVSFLLFLRKNRSSGPGYMGKRVIRLGHVFCFWFAVQYALAWLLTGKSDPLSLSLVLSGGPGLPAVGGSVFYFLSHLIILVVVLSLFIRLGDTAKNILSACIVTAAFSYFFASSTSGYCLPYEYLLSFVIYIPLAHYLDRNIDFFLRYRFLLFGLFFLALFYERLMRLLYHIPYAPYSRLSIFFGVVYFFALVFGRDWQQSPIVSALSRYSLGIFAVHKYFQLLAITLYDLSLGQITVLHDLNPVKYPLVLLATVLMTAVFLWWGRKTWLKTYIS